MAFGSTTHSDSGHEVATEPAADLPVAYGPHGASCFQMRPHSQYAGEGIGPDARGNTPYRIIRATEANAVPNTHGHTL